MASGQPSVLTSATVTATGQFPTGGEEARVNWPGWLVAATATTEVWMESKTFVVVALTEPACARKQQNANAKKVGRLIFMRITKRPFPTSLFPRRQANNRRRSVRSLRIL